jgi:hypothetical protein
VPRVVVVEHRARSECRREGREREQRRDRQRGADPAGHAATRRDAGRGEGCAEAFHLIDTIARTSVSRLVQDVTGRNGRAVGESRVRYSFTAPRASSMTRPRNADLAVGGDLEAEPARPSDRVALREGKPLRQRRAGGDQPAAEIRARRAGARILDHRAVLREEEARDERARAVGRVALRVGREDVGHRSLAGVTVRKQQVRTRSGAANRIGGGERHDQLLGSRVDPQRRRRGIGRDIGFREHQHCREVGA